MSRRRRLVNISKIFFEKVNWCQKQLSGNPGQLLLVEKAANLPYFVVKNHSFSDGNKRIAAFLFVWFPDRNYCLYHPDGSRRLADNALVALTLLNRRKQARRQGHDGNAGGEPD